MSTPISLPPPIADYFAADATDTERVARCFTESAVVIDEQREHRGQRAISRWKAEATAKYDYTSVPIAVEVMGPDTVVTAGSPATFPAVLWICGTASRSRAIESPDSRSRHEL